MKHRHHGRHPGNTGWPGLRRFARSVTEGGLETDCPDNGRHGGHREGHGGGYHGRGRHGLGRGGRPFDYGELRLLVLSLIAEQKRHGYDLIKVIEERFAGAYSPSPGVIYPTLSMLEEMGFIARDEAPDPGGASRKLYAVTAAGEAHLAAETSRLAAILTRMGVAARGPRGAPANILRAMENVKTALRLRLGRGDLDASHEQAIADTLDAAARAIEQS